MYRKVGQGGTPPESFEFPHGGKLASDNRWVRMAQLITGSRSEMIAAYDLGCEFKEKLNLLAGLNERSLSF